MNTSFSRFAGALGILTGIFGFLYLIFFVLLRNNTPMISALSLLLVGLLSTAVLVALYQRARTLNEGFALWALLLGLLGSAGGAIHGAYDLSNALHPTQELGVPFPADPRGFLTFVLAGLAALVLSWLLLRDAVFPRLAAYLGILAGALLIILYIAYLVTLEATNPLVLVLILATGVLQPLWYLWVGYWLAQGERQVLASSAAVTR
jgi:hypothetical protein